MVCVSLWGRSRNALINKEELSTLKNLFVRRGHEGSVQCSVVAREGTHDSPLWRSMGFVPELSLCRRRTGREEAEEKAGSVSRGHMAHKEVCKARSGRWAGQEISHGLDGINDSQSSR